VAIVDRSVFYWNCFVRGRAPQWKFNEKARRAEVDVDVADERSRRRSGTVHRRRWPFVIIVALAGEINQDTSKYPLDG